MKLILTLWLLICAVPSVFGATSTRSECIHNLRRIDGAKEQLELEQKLKPGTIVSAAQVAEFLKGELPKCPAGGDYDIGAIGIAATCSIPSHSLNYVEPQRNEAARTLGILGLVVVLMLSLVLYRRIKNAESTSAPADRAQ